MVVAATRAEAQQSREPSRDPAVAKAAQKVVQKVAEKVIDKSVNPQLANDKQEADHKAKAQQEQAKSRPVTPSATNTPAKSGARPAP